MKKKTARSLKAASVKKAKVVSVSSKNVSLLANEEIRSFLVHLILYLLGNVGLFVYLYSTNGNLAVFYWVVIGWGVGVVAHAMAVFGVMKFLAKEW